MNTTDYTFSFESSKTPEQNFDFLRDVRKWWVGLHGEEIKGNSKNLNDEFSFRAGGGVHHTEQRLVELATDKKITWEVTRANLSFLKNPSEWVGTKICFEISMQENKTQVRFTHRGLAPSLESYTPCSVAWAKYLENLAEKLK